MTRRAAALALAAWSCAAAAGGVEVAVRTAAGAPVEDAAVMLEPESRPPPLRRARATIEQRDREFIPYLTIVQKGTAVEFPNRDPFKHHVYSFSPAKTFEIKLYSDKPASPVVFDHTGEVVLGCNIHDWMEAHVLVVDTPWFAKTGAAGVARIADAPAGRYRLRVWHPRQKAQPEPVALVLTQATQRAGFTLDVAARPAAAKPPADPGSY